MYPFNTLQIGYRHIVDVHEGVLMPKILFLTNLQHFELSQFSSNALIDSLVIVHTL